MTATTTSRGLPFVCRTNPALTVDVPAVNVVVAVPVDVVVCAVVVIVVWFGTEFVVVPPTDRIAVPTLLLLSVAVTVTLPDRPVGTVMYPMNEPVVATKFVGVVATITLFIWTTIAEPTVYPLPMICTVLPVCAEVGETVSVGAVRVNVALAAFPDASVIVSVFVAVAVIGIVNCAANPPVEFVAVVFKVTAAPLTFAVIALVAAKPLALT